ncbi:hypothetical protein M885DRAFT_564844 [Pelagophyceae sp. CCMP2097]|nr:hypothetical protein M885DRAFT_564844 [Pelagophyceae sp. CCMP2097]
MGVPPTKAEWEAVTSPWVAIVDRLKEFKTATSTDVPNFDSGKVDAIVADNLQDDCDSAWAAGILRLASYKKWRGTAHVPPWYVMPDGFLLGEWVHDMRLKLKEEKLVEKQLKLFSALGFPLEEEDEKWFLECLELDNLEACGDKSFASWILEEDAWKAGFASLQAHKALNGDCRVPADFVDDVGFVIGNWVRQQRLKLKGADGGLTDAQTEKLDGIGFVWAEKDEASKAKG